MKSISRELLAARHRHQSAITGWRRVGNHVKEVFALLRLAEFELDIGDSDRAARSLRNAESVLVGIPDQQTNVIRKHRERLEKLWERLPQSERKRRSFNQAESGFDLDAHLAFVWADVAPEKGLLEIEKQKSSALLQVMRDDQRERDSELLDVLSRLGTAEKTLVRPMEISGKREVFVDYFMGEHETVAFLESPGNPIRCYPLDVSRSEIDVAIQNMRRSFDGGGMRMPILPEFPEEVSLDGIYALGRRLTPFLEDLKSFDFVCVFPHGALHSFPFAVIPDDDGIPLIEHAAVVYSLSRRTLAVARTASRSNPGAPAYPRSALAVAVPSVEDKEPETFIGEASFLSSLESLEREPESLETPHNATVEKVMSCLGSFDLVHFNCHGLFSATSPLDSCLLLSEGEVWPSRTQSLSEVERPGHLDARTVFKHRRKVDTDTIVLRACSSGVTNVREGDEQEGLLRAMIHMGIATCVVARWNIDTASSRDLIRAFYRAWLVDKLPKGIALQKAQRAMLKDERTYLHHPYHWAPFKMVGDWW